MTMTRYAIPVTDGKVANHLGGCRTFLIVDVDEHGEIKQQTEVPNPGHGPGGPPPHFLARMGVQQVIAWGAPVHAREMLAGFGVKIQLGATGEPLKVLRDFLSGTLELTTEGLDGGGRCAHADVPVAE